MNRSILADWRYLNLQTFRSHLNFLIVTDGIINVTRGYSCNKYPLLTNCQSAHTLPVSTAVQTVHMKRLSLLVQHSPLLKNQLRNCIYLSIKKCAYITIVLAQDLSYEMLQIELV